MTRFTSDSPTFDEIRKLRKPRQETVWLALDADLLAEISELERDVERARRADERENRRPEAPRMEARLVELKERAEEIAVSFTLQELPRKQYREIIDAHESDDPGLRWDEDTFAPALIAACAVKPELTLEQATEIWDEWSHSAAYVLFGAAIEVNEAPTKVPFGVQRSPGTPDSEPSSTTAPLEESDTPSS